MKKIDIFLAVFFHILVFLTMLIIFNPHVGDYFDVSRYLVSDVYADIDYPTAIAFVMIVSFLGALIPFPVPYIIPAGNFALTWYNNDPNPWPKIIVMIFLAALGNSAGDFIDYIIGRSASSVVEKDNPAQIEKWTKRIENRPNLICAAIFLFAVFPLPNSILLVTLGFLRYPRNKTLIYMYMGKVCMFLIVALGWIFAAERFVDLLGEEGGSPWIGMAILYIMWTIIFIMAKKK